MNLRNIGIVISREFSTRVRKKSFIVITFAGPLLFALIYAIPVLIMTQAKDKVQTVEVVDASGIVMPWLESGAEIDYTDCSTYDLDDLKAGMEDNGANAVLYISPLDPETMNVNVEMYSLKPVTMGVQSDVEDKVRDAVEDYRIKSYDIPDLKELIDNIKPDVRLATYTIQSDGSEKITSSGVFEMVSMVLAIIIFMFVSMFGAMVMSSIIEEKSSKVVEVLASSVKATELMFGKILGVACVALTQFFLWIVLIVVIVAGFNTFGGFNSLMEAVSNGGTEQIASMAGMDALGSMPGMDALGSISGTDPSGSTADGMAALSPTVDTLAGTDASEAAPANSEYSEIATIMSTLKGLDYGKIIWSFLAFFLLGYLLYASMFAAIGSAVDNEADTSQLQIPVTGLLMIGFFIAIYVFKSPDSGLAFWGSIIPFTSPIVMLARIPFGVATWEIVLSIVLLLLTFVFCAWLSAKIYRIGILTSGKKTTFSDLWRWLRQKE